MPHLKKTFLFDKGNKNPLRAKFYNKNRRALDSPKARLAYCLFNSEYFVRVWHDGHAESVFFNHVPGASHRNNWSFFVFF